MSAGLGFKDKRFLQTLEYIDDEYLEDVFNILKEPDMAETEYKKPSPFKYLKQYLAAAACILVLSLLIPVFGYVADVIGSIAAGTGSATSEITEAPLYEETETTVQGETTAQEEITAEPLNEETETTAQEETTAQDEITAEPAPNFQFSDVKIVADNTESINPVSVRIGYTWYKDEKSVWTEEIAGWSYIINNEKYRYDKLPHLTLDRIISSILLENITISNFTVYSANWEKSEYSFDNLYELSNLPAGDYIIVGIENENIPFDQPHSVIGEYDYKIKKSAIVFGLTVTNLTVAVNDLEYLKFTTDLEDIDYDTMLEVKNAWAGFKSTGYSDFTYDQLFNSKYFFHYGYLGRSNEAVVIATFTLKQREPISMELVYDLIIEIYVYTDGNIISLEDSYKMKIISYDDMQKFKSRSEKYESFRFRYSTRESEQTDR
ncbi:MAG: hypothetical protein IIX44_08800 [Clostridia bacterium]|nr:hypothetical protein [Clostridia bacterium]